MGLPDDRGRADIFEHYLRGLKLDPRHWGCSRRMRRGAIEWTFIGWNEMRA
jgi:hypothetical protein